jgi:hypothetical protein
VSAVRVLLGIAGIYAVALLAHLLGWQPTWHVTGFARGVWLGLADVYAVAVVATSLRAYRHRKAARTPVSE